MILTMRGSVRWKWQWGTEMNVRITESTLEEALSKHPNYAVRVWVEGTFFNIPRDEFKEGMKERTAKMIVEIDHFYNEIDLGSIYGRME